MGLSLGEIAGRYGCELHGDPDIEVNHVATLSGANDQSISFLANSAYRSQLDTTSAAAVIVGPDDLEACPAAALLSPNPYLVYAHIANDLHPPRPLEPGIDPSARVADGCTIPESCQVAPGAVVESGVVLGERVFIGPNVVVGRDSTLGDDTRVMSGVILYHGVRIGQRCIFHGGVVIGADGFGIAPDGTGAWTKVPQIGSVLIGDDVEIGANTTIDRGAIEDTVIHEGVKLDNHIQVAHNVSIGAHTVIAALTGISGSVKIGARCHIGGHAGFAGHIEVTDDVIITAGTPVIGSIKRPGAYGGVATSADDIRSWRKNAARFGQLDKMARRLHALEKRFAEESEKE